MIKIIDIENAEKSDILTRDIKLESGVEAIVSDIIANVRANGDKALLARVEHLGDLDRIIEVWHTVSWPMVQEVAQQHNTVIAEAVGGRKRRLKCGRHAVDVTDEDDLHAAFRV